MSFHDIIISDQHHERNVYVGEFWKELTGLRLAENENICVYSSQFYEPHEFVGDVNQTWAGIGVLIKL